MASDVYPVSGKVLAVNEALGATPELINQAWQGWLMKIRPAIAEVAKLLVCAYKPSLTLRLI
jgi:glycine cleavage system H protein